MDAQRCWKLVQVSGLLLAAIADLRISQIAANTMIRMTIMAMIIATINQIHFHPQLPLDALSD
jgi:hypothetical protein